MEYKDGVKVRSLPLIYSASSKGTGLQSHSCSKGVSEVSDISAPEVLHTSSAMRCFTPSKGIIDRWAVMGETTETKIATSINMPLNFMLYFNEISKHVNIKL